VVVTNPEVSSVRDSDRILGVLQSKSKRAEEKRDKVKEHLLVTRYDPIRAERGEMLKLDDVREILAIPVAGRGAGERERAPRVQHRHAGDHGRGEPGG
jgi:septum site-determining protein MinD